MSRGHITVALKEETFSGFMTQPKHLSRLVP